MDELRKINSKIAVKQIRRLVGALVGTLGCAFLATKLVAEFAYQKGITDCQKCISNAFPDEYAAMTEKVIKSFEKH